MVTRKYISDQIGYQEYHDIAQIQGSILQNRLRNVTITEGISKNTVLD